MSFPARLSALTVLALVGCIPSIVVGDAPQDTDDATTSSPDTGTGSTGPTSSTGELPTTTLSTGFCGDGQHDPGETCDDGNDEPNDGCDNACARSGRIEWTLEPDGADVVVDLVVGAAGQIVISGLSGQQTFLLALSPDGVEQWRVPMDDGKLAVHADGRIFLGTGSGELHALSPTGAELWTVEPAGQASFFGLAAAGDHLYAGLNGQFDDDPSQRIVVRKHPLQQGAALWEAASELHSVGEDLVVLGDRVAVVGRAHVQGVEGDQSLLAVIHEGGGWLPAELAGTPAHASAVAASPSGGDLVLAGFGSDPELLLQRRGADLGELWSVTGTGTFSTTHLAAGPDERLALIGFDAGDNPSSVVRLYDGSGALQWTSVFALTNPDLFDLPVAGAFGPDFLVVAGQVLDEVEDTTHARMWVRRLALD
ncbi:Myxococcus cysteine-rich repeat-containing protein [Nannocystis exedens]|uniref:Myxococcus cysteine-rich repeat-containing protein n=1 Tax=Nannocystis exedens TaxID=54 RepID=A0A1I2F853_9BACT|nr:PQQ-binding-like beta-propeller repeat protein [Nannocystis exedens]PCC73031.1 hypothetical protein NAEX_06117 [Nannocystis exedens]SFF01203.1 Myxococcus cysteine-rich repeat-containing protein [Nannocystis exedens]